MTKKLKLTPIEASSIALKLLGVRVKRRQTNRVRGKKLHIINDMELPRCILCSEDRVLEKAHIIPVTIYENIHLVAGLAPIYNHAMWMCPTHHKCYDKYKLNEQEKAHIRWILSHDYNEAFGYLIESIEILQKPLLGQEKKKIDDKLETSWRWWREYCYGNA